jgi:hypothetical protein
MSRHDLQPLFVRIVPPASFNAGKKAFDDVNRTLERAGFRAITLDLSVSKIKRLLLAPFVLLRMMSALAKRSNLVVLQYPLPMEVRRFAEAMVRSRRARVVMLLHDVDTMRYSGRTHRTDAELEFFAQADAVICHNAAMKQWLQGRGLKTPSVGLGLFDYLVDASATLAPTEDRSLDWRRTIVFAGSLSRTKSGFIYGLPDDFAINIRVFGMEPPGGANFSPGISYSGRFPPDSPVLPRGLFGLVWDGADADSCSGTSGEYLKINSPHKASLYLACGLPIICWRESALAAEVAALQVGIAVGSLHELADILQNLPQSTYESMCQRAAEVGSRLRDGAMLQTALHRAIETFAGSKPAAAVSNSAPLDTDNA